MIERFPRKIERLISISLVTAAAIGGYALGERGDGRDRAAAEPAVAATAPLIPRKAAMQPPLVPTGGDYNIAEDAVYAADQGDFGAAEKELATITDPAVKAQAEHALQVVYATEAAYDAGNSDIPTALFELGRVTLADVKAKAGTAVAYGIADEAAYDACNGGDYASAQSLEPMITDPALVAKVEQTISQEKSGNTSGANDTWKGLHNTANAQWVDLHNQANVEWTILYLHGDDYRRYYDQAA